MANWEVVAVVVVVVGWVAGDETGAFELEEEVELLVEEERREVSGGDDNGNEDLLSV